MKTNNMKTIPFSIPEFEKRGGIGKCKVVTRGTHTPVRILATDTPSVVFPVVAIIGYTLRRFTESGQFIYGENHEQDLLILDETPVKYRPWTKAELAKLLIEKGPVIVKSKDDENEIWILAYSQTHTLELLKKWTLLDGTPCGVEESV